MTIDITKEELDIIKSALLSYSGKLYDFAEMYKKNKDVNNQKDCIDSMKKADSLRTKLMSL